MNRKTVEREVEQLGVDMDLLKRQVAFLTDGWGRFVEGIVQPCVPKVFSRLGIDVPTTAQSYKRRRNGETLEVDVVAVGMNDAVAVSVKTTLSRQDDIDDFERDLKRFFDFFPEFQGKRLIGAVAAISVKGGVDRYAEKKGFFVLRPGGNTMKLSNSRGFKPRLWT